MDKNSMDLDKPMFPISVIADMLKVHQRTLRIYDDEKILCPARTPKGRRLYSFNDIEKGKLIRHLTGELGLNLAGVKITLVLLEETGISPDNHAEKVNSIIAQYGLKPENAKCC